MKAVRILTSEFEKMTTTETDPDAVRVSRSENGHVWTVTLHRPQARNAIDRRTAAKLHKAFLDFERDENARVAVLYGEGGVFCSGADLKAVAAASVSDAVPSFTTGGSSDSFSVPFVTEPLREEVDGLDKARLQSGVLGPTRMQLSKPVIAAVSGYAVAGGLELALWCDVRLCDDTAVFGVFCRRFGVPLIDGGTFRLARCIGHGRAMDMILTGRSVDADEALAMGLVSRVVVSSSTADGSAGSSVVAEAQVLAHELAALPQNTMRMDRRALLEQWGLGENAALHREWELGRRVLGAAVRGAGVFRDGRGRGGSKL